MSKDFILMLVWCAMPFILHGIGYFLAYRLAGKEENPFKGKE